MTNDYWKYTEYYNIDSYKINQHAKTEQAMQIHTKLSYDQYRILLKIS